MIFSCLMYTKWPKYFDHSSLKLWIVRAAAHCCNKLDFLLKSLRLFSSTGKICILPIRGEKRGLSDFEWDLIVRTRKVASIISKIVNFLDFLVQEYIPSLKNCILLPSEKWNWGQKLLVNNRGARWLTYIVCNNRRELIQKIVSQYNSESLQNNLYTLWILKPILRILVWEKRSHNTLTNQCIKRNTLYTAYTLWESLDKNHFSLFCCINILYFSDCWIWFPKRITLTNNLK